MGQIAIRTFATSGTDSSADPTLFVAVPTTNPTRQVRRCEVRGFDKITFTGAPTSVTLSIWRRVDGLLDRMKTITLTPADVAAIPSPVVIDPFDGQDIYVTIDSFVAGTTPKLLEGTLFVRPLPA